MQGTPLKTPKYLTFAILLVLLLWPSPSAQAQADPACKLEGPSIADTLTYISGILSSSPPVAVGGGQTWQARLSVSPDGTKIFNETFTAYNGVVSDMKEWEVFPVQAIKCSLTSGSGKYGPFLWIDCEDGKNCVTRRDVNADITYTAQSSFHVNLDADHCDRLQRAISHLIALLQKQYSETHTDTDPFSK